ncbi:MAG: DNA repair protein, partial [Proteobacteria bacterium]|nr:DNA repair protein [Desulfocapsa sp.]MBU3945544.1 DNA repair protein [Pseudomonadota bacterium]MBU4027239.1 DNA repair protein [Pseudomonadota bacterium]MBU4042091.1 DNA repair protein [Pseudomonadota bacterium]MBU4106183.1 DNA repair protein [Pseudomonadota bacterium]
MQLFIKDEQGKYITATTPEIIKEGRSRTRSTLKKGSEFIGGSQAAKEAIASKISSYQHEVFGCLFLDTKNCILEWKEMFRGTIDSTTVYPREVVKEALQLNAAKVILAHNHPSGNTDPSPQDIELTKKLKEILKIIDVKILDHIIVGDNLTSFMDS